MTMILEGLTAALAFLLPFEVRTPVLSLPFMGFTILELTVLGVLVLSLLQGEWRGFLLAPHRRLTTLAVLLAGLFLVSAIRAPAYWGASLKFALRTLTGVGLFAVLAGRGRTGRASPSDERTPVRFILSLVGGAAVSSALGIWTCISPEGSAWLSPWFREREFLIGNTIRLSGTFEYPNIAAAFLALAFVLSLACIPADGRWQTADERKGLWGLRLPFAGLAFCWPLAQGVILLGLIMTLSRAGLVVALMGLTTVLGCHAWKACEKGPGRGFVPALLIAAKAYRPTLLVSAGCLAGALVFYPPFTLRFQTGGDAAWYRATYESPDSLRLVAGELSTVPVRLTNTGRMTWSAGGQHPFRLSYHWLEVGTGNAIPAAQARTELLGEVRPGASVTLKAKVAAPARSGDYVLAWDMVHERTAWFSQKGCPTGQVACRVTAATGGRPVALSGEEVPPDPGALEAESVSRGTLWRAGWEMFKRYPILGVGPDNFRRLWGREFGMTRWDERVHANNLFVEVFATTGVLGGGAFLWLVAAVLSLQVRTLRQTPGRGVGFSAMAALFAATCAFLAHGMLDYFLAFTPMYLLFWMVAGFSVRMAEEREA